MGQLFRFPNPVNERSARLVAAGVVAQVVALVVTRNGWLLVPLVYGFAARVATGPTLSPLGQLVTRVLTPLLSARLASPPRLVPGPPKRFAQGVGLAFSASAAALWVWGASSVAVAVLVALGLAAALEAFAGVCLGCIGYAALFDCDDCDDISARLRAAISTQRHDAVGSPATR